MADKSQPISQNSEEIRISDLILNVRQYFKHVVKRWWVIIIGMIICAFLGGLYAWFQDEDYITKATYIIDSDATANSFMSSLTSLAGSLGMSGSSSSGEGFSNELLHGIIKSRRIIKGALVEKTMVKGKLDHMANHFIRMYPDYAEDERIEWFIQEHDSLNQLTRVEDSVLELLYLRILDRHLTVAYAEETALNELTVRSLDRDFSVDLCNYVLNSASEFFIEAAVSKEKQSYELAVEQADSLFALLKSKEQALARITDESGYKYKAIGFIEEGRLIRDIEIMSTMYGESYGSLQMAKFNLEDKKPIIEVVDDPEFSTVKEVVKLVAFTIIFGVIGLFVTIIVLILQKLIQDLIREEKDEDAINDQLATPSYANTGTGPAVTSASVPDSGAPPPGAG